MRLGHAVMCPVGEMYRNTTNRINRQHAMLHIYTCGISLTIKAERKEEL